MSERIDPKHILVTGGSRSGKSQFAETKGSLLSGQVVYLATAEAQDSEMLERIPNTNNVALGLADGRSTSECNRKLLNAIKLVIQFYWTALPCILVIYILNMNKHFEQRRFHN